MVCVAAAAAAIALELCDLQPETELQINEGFGACTDLQIFHQSGSIDQSQLYDFAPVAGEMAFLLALLGKTADSTWDNFDLKKSNVPLINKVGRVPLLWWKGRIYSVAFFLVSYYRPF